MTSATVVSCLRYRDAEAAIEWLCSVFGFQRHLVVPGDRPGIVKHAQLKLGKGMVMLGSAENESAYGKLLVQPGDIGGRQTQTVYLVVDDADLVHRRAVEAGAQVVLELKDEAHGGRGFTCRDLEGHVWSIGTYDPWKE